jgi:hypothetical protein
MTTVQRDLAGRDPGLAGLLADLGQDRLAADGPVITAGMPVARLEDAVRRIAARPRARLADVFASAADHGEPVVLRLAWGLDADRAYLVTESVIEAERYPSLSDIAPAAFYEECEIYEQFGIRPAGAKPLNRVALPPIADCDLPRLGPAPAQPPADVHAPHVVGGHAFEFAFGPVRQVGVESLYYGLVTSGEEVVDLYLFTWHKHRGMEWRLQGRTPRDALFHVERTEGLGAVGPAWAFAAAAEAALGLAPPAQAERARAIALELDRLYNHAAATAALCQSTGLVIGGRGDRAGAAAAPERRRLRAPLPVRRGGHRRRGGRPGRGGAATRPPRRLRRAPARCRRAADDQLLPRPAGGHGNPVAGGAQNVFTDIPIIEASFWLTVAGTAR